MWNPALVSILFISIIIGLVVHKADGDILELAQIGTQFSEADPKGSEGYDGQFNYYLALDSNPNAVANKLDVPAYRYQRILLPLLGSLLSFGQKHLIPWIMLLVSLLIHFFATQKISEILLANGESRWFALGYGLWVGIVLSIRLNLSEALAIGLFLIAYSYLLKSQHLIAWLCLCLAVFAKETMLIFVLAFGLYYLAAKQWRNIAGLFSVSILPFVIFQLWLFNLFGEFGIGAGGIRATPFEMIPFNGIWKIANFGWPVFVLFIALYLPLVILPTLSGIWFSGKKYFQGERGIEVFFLLITAPIFMFLPFALYSEPIGLLRLLSMLMLAGKDSPTFSM